LEEGAIISDLKNILIKKYPKLSELKSLALACNEEYAEDDLVVPAHATIALIPPVSGG
jgi:molybdopterin synthase sulfur carrier subunit